MSLLLLLGAVNMLEAGISPEMEYLIVWALFSIADATWITSIRGGK